MADQADPLDMAIEEVLEPDIPICDPHLHLWGRRGGYFWEDLAEDTRSGHRIERTVFVECTESYYPDGPEVLRPVGESEFAAGQAQASRAAGGPLIAGIVAHVDLSLGVGLEEVLEAHEVVADGLLRGFRQDAAWDPSPDVPIYRSVPERFLYESEVRVGLGVLADRGYVLDVLVFHPQIPEVADLARAVPQATIVLDHLGCPLGIGPYSGRREEVRAVWRRMIAEVASCPNVLVKLGGIGMDIFGVNLTEGAKPPASAELAKAWEPEIVWCIEKFGPDRCMFESNFPVDRRSTPYPVLWNAFKRIVAGGSVDEKSALFHHTATRTYRLS